MDRLMSAIEEIHLIELETGWDDGVECELRHDDASNCTHEVVARRIIGCNGHSYLMCAFGTNYTYERMAAGHAHNKCGTLIADCWKVLPA